MKTEIIVINDISSSMKGCAQGAIDGFNKFLDEQRDQAGEARITQVQFNEGYTVVYQGRNIQNVEPLNHFTYRPNGSTALRDAIGRTLNDQGARIANEKWADLVILLVQTDGEENCSKCYSDEQIKAMSEHAQAKGWKIIYLAPEKSVYHTTTAYGFNPQFARGVNYAEPEGALKAYHSASVTASSFRAPSDSTKVELTP